MKNLVGTMLLVLMCGCQQTREIIITPYEIPIKISKNGCFVTSHEFINLINGENVRYYNGRINKIYLSPNLIIIKDDKIYLKSAENK